MEPLDELASLVQKGENTMAVACANRMLSDSYSVEDIVGAVSEGLIILRDKCTIENFQLLDVLLASRAMAEVVDECIAKELQNEMDNPTNQDKINKKKEAQKTLVIGTIQGDVHDLGKHVLATLCRFSNLNVVNIGKDMPVEAFVKAAIKEKADFVGVSCLMTVCLTKIKDIKSALVEKGYGHIKVVGGGSAAQQSSAEALNIDYLAYDAFEGMDYFSNSG
jgi:methylmalonyl-CoA mutase cobalamin-binding domain/chain